MGRDTREGRWVPQCRMSPACKLSTRIILYVYCVNIVTSVFAWMVIIWPGGHWSLIYQHMQHNWLYNVIIRSFTDIFFILST